MVRISGGSRLLVMMVERLAVAFDDELVEVVGLGGFQSVQREVVDDEQFDAVQFAHLVFVAAVQACAA